MTARITEYKLDPIKIYVITKIFEDRSRRIKSIGEVYPIKVGTSCICGGWITTAVQDITLVGKGVIIETQNSTYLIEEFQADTKPDASSDEG